MAFLDSPEAYEALGLEPPESIPHGTETDLEIARGLTDHTCFWQGRGNHIWCDRGPHEHGRHIPADHILIGTGPHGQPLFKVIDNSFPSSEDK